MPSPGVAPRGGQKGPGRMSGREGGLEIVAEDVLAAIPRGDEELRVTAVRARKPDGGEAAWHSLRVFWRDEGGNWRPGKAGITIRARELRAVVDALGKAPR